jgi:hypothetical protein
LALFQDTAEARRRRKKRRRRRRRKAQVNNPLPLQVLPGAPVVLEIVNLSDTSPLTISAIKVLDEVGSVIRTIDLPDVTIDPDDTGNVTIPITESLVDAEGLRLIDGRGVPITLVDATGTPITVVDENGVTVSVGDVDIA